MAEEMTPEHMRGLVLRTVALAPIWMMSGLGGAHQKADVYIVGRLMEEGAVWINEENKLEVDVEKAVPIIKRIAEECVILERPKAHLKEAKKLLAKELAEVGDIEKAAGKRAESMFGKENIDKIAEKLKPVADPIMDEPMDFVYYAYLSGNLMNQKI
ncbi:MAG: hypothetical protein AB1468_01770 [Candidatus Micrarchaeota archaeon]